MQKLHLIRNLVYDFSRIMPIKLCNSVINTDKDLAVSTVAGLGSSDFLGYLTL